MNERLKQLAMQAGSTHKDNLGVYQFYSHELEIFAKLIIQEYEREKKEAGQEFRKGTHSNQRTNKPVWRRHTTDHYKVK